MPVTSALVAFGRVAVLEGQILDFDDAADRVRRDHQLTRIAQNTTRGRTGLGVRVAADIRTTIVRVHGRRDVIGVSLTNREEHHFAFEAVAWYWHFVDVVWIGLFIFVYWL